MLEDRDFHIRVTPTQHARIKLKAELKGYKNISSYVRDRLVRTPIQTEKQLKEIHEALKSQKQEI